MPHRPGWYTQIPKIRRQLEKLDVPTLDRASFELLFGVRKRQANNLIRVLGGYKVGTSFVIGRLEVLDKLDELSAVRGVAAAETQRKINVLERIEALRLEPRMVRIQRQPPRSNIAETRLPDGISVLSPGQLVIDYSRPEQVLERVLALVEMANQDVSAFLEAIASAGT